jgi:hypothetical protein
MSDLSHDILEFKFLYNGQRIRTTTLPTSQIRRSTNNLPHTNYVDSWRNALRGPGATLAAGCRGIDDRSSVFDGPCEVFP